MFSIGTYAFLFGTRLFRVEFANFSLKMLKMGAKCVSRRYS